MLVQQSYRPSNQRLLLKTLQLIDSMADNLRLYRLRCNIEPEAALVAYEGMHV